MKMSLLGIVVIVVSLFFLRGKWGIYQIEKEGSVVDMRIIKLPSFCELSKGKYYMDVEYAGQVFNKRIPTGFCNTHNTGDIVKMKYLDGHESILFPNEKVQGDFIALGIFLFVGVLALLLGIFYKKKK